MGQSDVTIIQESYHTYADFDHTDIMLDFWRVGLPGIGIVLKSTHNILIDHLTQIQSPVTRAETVVEGGYWIFFTRVSRTENDAVGDHLTFPTVNDETSRWWWRHQCSDVMIGTLGPHNWAWSIREWDRVDDYYTIDVDSPPSFWTTWKTNENSKKFSWIAFELNTLSWVLEKMSPKRGVGAAGLFWQGAI